MSEEKKDEILEEGVHTISMRRHLWPDEVELRDAKRKASFYKKLTITLSIMCLLVGFFFGNIFLVPQLSKIRNLAQTGIGSSSAAKEETIRDLLENSWYFGKDIEDLDTRLTDQAITGMATNEEDLHTEYMSAEERESFVQGINRNYVGIGAQFIMYNGLPMVTRVFNNSPAEKSGLQAGDIITEVDGNSIQGYDSTTVREVIQGEEDTNVVLTVLRGNQDMKIVITRGAVSATVYSYMLDEDTLYLQLYQFGDTTAEVIKENLDTLIGDKTNVSMILDLRDNGGGYLDSVQAVASLFLDENLVVLTQEFADGTSRVTRTSGEKYEQVNNIVVLVNENTASASEVMTLALQQNRDDVTVVGKTTYGKGTVQVTATFTDGSALKYTNSRWLSPNGDWINGDGITPDEEVDLPEAMTNTFPAMEEDVVYEVDTVSDVVLAVQRILTYFAYPVDRTDGYFSQATLAVWQQFSQDHNIEVSNNINYDSYMQALSEVMYDWASTTVHDTQLLRAQEIVNG